MGLYFKKPYLYIPKTCTTYCFRLPSGLDPKRHQVNTWSTDEKEAARIRDDIVKQTMARRDGQIYEEAYLDKAVEAYLNAKGGLNRKTHKRYSAVVHDFMGYVVSELKHMPTMAEVKRPVIDKYLGSLLTKGRCTNTVNDIRNILTNLFIYAVDNNWVQINPVHKIKKLPEPERHFEPLTMDEVRQILEHLKNERNNHRRLECYYEVMAVIYYAGLRISEVTHLLRSDVDLNTHTLLIHNKTIGGTQYVTKTKRNWRAPINAELEIILKEWLEKTKDNGTELLFPNSKNKPIKNDHIGKEVKKVMRILKFSEKKMKKPLHGGRHAFCSHALASGVPEMIVQNALGHKSNVMTRHYAHMSPQYVREQFDKLKYIYDEKKGAE